MNKQLLLTQCAAALCTLREGGHFVVKAFDLFTPFSAGLFYLLHSAFEDVCIYKPAQSRPANSERYFVCRAMRAGGGGLGEHLLEVNDKLNAVKPSWPCTGKGGGGRDVSRLVPNAVLKEEPFASYLSESNNRTAELQDETCSQQRMQDPRSARLHDLRNARKQRTCEGS